MIALDVAQTLREQVADSLETKPLSGSRISVGVPFTYRDGDPCGFIIERNDTSGGWHITDEGDVTSHAEYFGVDLLSIGRRERFNTIIDFFGVREDSGQLFLEVDGTDFGSAALTFTQACLELMHSAELPAKKQRTKPSQARKRLEEIIIPALPPNAKYKKHWHHPVFDPDGVYPVDLVIEGAKQAHLYLASGNLKALQSAVSCLHYQQKSLPFIGLAVFDDDAEMKEQYSTPLRDAVDRSFNASEMDELAEFLQSVA